MNPKEREQQRRRMHAKNVARQFKALEADIAKRFADICKPCPRWCPVWFWAFMQSKFLNLD